METDAARAPPGWRVNPSATGQRAPVVALALAGLGVSIAAAEPLDVVAFTAVAALAALGGLERWRVHPRLVLALGGATSLTAAFMVARWSVHYASAGTTTAVSFLATAIAVAITPLVADEVYAAAVPRCASRPAPRLVFSGKLGVGPRDVSSYFAGGGAILLGLWLVVAPEALLGQEAARHAHLLGALVAAIGALTLARVARPLRWLNAAIGVWLLLSPVVFEYGLLAAIHSIVVGIPLLMVSALLADSEQARSDG